MSHISDFPVSTYIRCIGRRKGKKGPFAGVRAVHILLGRADDEDSLHMSPVEVLEAVNDLCRTKDGVLRHVVICGADTPGRQQEALLLGQFLQLSSSYIKYPWVSPIDAAQGAAS